MITELLTVPLLLIAAGALLLVFRQLQACRVMLRRVNTHRIAARSAVQKRRMDLMEVRNRTKLLEETVSGGTSAVEKVHKTISSTTFGLIDLFSRDEDFRKNALKARTTHDQTSSEIYNAVRTTNRALHILADTLIISKVEKRIISRHTRRPRNGDDQSG
ncbi:hypothetical protein DET50_1326 [Marinobacter pelagius]|uniref:Uncharacterized protein n=1 Tax=Marinobacter pelagius TaxID=379482 RepID=A0A366G2B2_9GAMM|nr:hypothetical protein [Marinobacter pelagius]RBP20526.1 hypothetical protein DET50_1326 [Marinobacter pelagius]